MNAAGAGESRQARRWSPVWIAALILAAGAALWAGETPAALVAAQLAAGLLGRA